VSQSPAERDSTGEIVAHPGKTGYHCPINRLCAWSPRAAPAVPLRRTGSLAGRHL